MGLQYGAPDAHDRRYCTACAWCIAHALVARGLEGCLGPNFWAPGKTGENYEFIPKIYPEFSLYMAAMYGILGSAQLCARCVVDTCHVAQLNRTAKVCRSRTPDTVHEFCWREVGAGPFYGFSVRGTWVARKRNPGAVPWTGKWPLEIFN